jgi:transcription antitermination factor NusG
MPITQRSEDNQFAVGQRVRIHIGPLGGLDGVVVDNRAPRLVLSVHLIHTTTHVELDQDSIVAVPMGLASAK